MYPYVGSPAGTDPFRRDDAADVPSAEKRTSPAAHRTPKTQAPSTVPCNIGFVSTRFSGTDGVSLESAKWAQVLWDHQHVSYWYAGKLDRDPAVSMLVPEAYFYDRDNVWINEHAFGTRRRTPEMTRKIYQIADYLKGTLYDFVDAFSGSTSWWSRTPCVCRCTFRWAWR